MAHCVSPARAGRHDGLGSLLEEGAECEDASRAQGLPTETGLCFLCPQDSAVCVGKVMRKKRPKVTQHKEPRPLLSSFLAPLFLPSCLSTSLVPFHGDPAYCFLLLRKRGRERKGGNYLNQSLTNACQALFTRLMLTGGCWVPGPGRELSSTILTTGVRGSVILSSSILGMRKLKLE